MPVNGALQKSTPLKSIVRSFAGVALLVVSLSACGSGGGEPKASSSAVTTPSTSSASAPSASSASTSTTTSQTSSSSQSEPSSPASAGGQTVTSQKGKASFQVPEGWQVIDAKAIDNPKAREALQPMAQKAGLSVDQYIQNFTKMVDVMVMDQSGDHGGQNISVVSLPTSTLPNMATYKSTFQRMGASVVETKSITTATGPGERLDYTLDASGQKLSGVMVLMKNGAGQISQVTVTANNAEQAKKLADRVISSWKKA